MRAAVAVQPSRMMNGRWICHSRQWRGVDASLYRRDPAVVFLIW
ncbi:MAG: hypothetical protein ABIK95_06105 [Acidobacteriota bacterium]